MKNKHNMKRIKDMLCQYAKACKKQAKIRLTLKNKHNCKRTAAQNEHKRNKKQKK